MSMDWSNTSLHFAEPDGSLEPTLSPELESAGFGIVEDDHIVGLFHKGDPVAMFTHFAPPSTIRAAAFDHLKEHGAEYAPLLHGVKHGNS